VHGGGGRAFKDWAAYWAGRGYAALAMDTAGQGPDGNRHPHAGPDQSDATKFQAFDDAGLRDMWTFHAVAAILRGHSLLASCKEVDAERIGITGISWGGYLTCIAAGVDPALKAAVPVYGCGYLGENSVWRDRALAALTADERDRWLRWFDPSVWLPGARCPMLFLNGTKDFAYPPDSYRKTYQLVPAAQRTIAVRVDLPHGHIWTFGEVDAFMDHALKPGPDTPALVRLGETKPAHGMATAPVLAGSRPVSATLHLTSDTGDWTTRQWSEVAAEVTPDALQAALPPQRPLTFFFTATDDRGLITSSLYAEIGSSDNSACQPVGKLEEDFYDWSARHETVLKLKEVIQPEIVMIGDSITHLWGGEPAEPNGNKGADSWKSLFGNRPVLNLGFGWDRTQNVLWRIQHGELQGLHPRYAVIHIGTNNLAHTTNARENTPAEIAEGIRSIIEHTKAQCPGVRIILMAVMPRGEKPNDPARLKVAAINTLLPAVATATEATLLDITSQLLEPDGSLSRETMPDFLHPGPKAYALWAEAVRPYLQP
jgi:lysophospholipase L1-like esterase/dienelactone hydrolase